MKNNDLMKHGEKKFISPCIKNFAFLEDEYNFSVSVVAAGCETTVVYTSGNICISLGFAMMEVPYLTLEQIEDGKIKKEKFFQKPKTSNEESVLQLEKSRDNNSPDIWCDNFRQGEYDTQIDNVLVAYANTIKEFIDSILNADFSIKI